MKSKYGHVLGIAVSAALLAPLGEAQGFSVGSSSAATPTAAPATTNPAARVPASLLDQSATPALLELANGKLSIRATNSSLRAILGELQTRIGTQVEGLTRDERVFGVYGPGDPQAVLASLLDDSGYNVLIAGRRPNGAPRQVVLSPRTSVTAMQAQAAPRTQAAEEEDDSSDMPEPQQMPAPPPAVPAAPANAGANPAVKTPQQMLEELQRLRQSATGQPQ